MKRRRRKYWAFDLYVSGMTDEKPIILNTANLVSDNKYIWENIPQDVKRLLFTSNADRPNTLNQINLSFDFMGNVKTVNNLPDDPSTIYFKAPISEPVDPSSVPRPPYYPSYAGLTPEQRFIYLKWLQNIEAGIDVGYKFLFYYGLERHLLVGDFDNAYDMIIRLRKSTSNTSFRGYSVNALVYSLLIRNRPDCFYKLKFLYDDEKWYKEQLWVKIYTDDTINPEELVRIIRTQDINKRYINKEPELYAEMMEAVLFEEFRHPYLEPNDFTSKKCSGVFGRVLFANYSFPDNARISDNIPDLDLSKFYACIIDLHNKCHESIKAKVATRKTKAAKKTHVETKGNDNPLAVEYEVLTSPEQTVPQADTPVNDSPLFSMTIDFVGSLSGRGTYVIGKISEGSTKINEEVTITGGNWEIRAKISGIDNKIFEERGQIVLYLSGVDKKHIAPGDIVIVKEGSESVKNLVDEALLP